MKKQPRLKPEITAKEYKELMQLSEKLIKKLSEFSVKYSKIYDKNMSKIDWYERFSYKNNIDNINAAKSAAVQLQNKVFYLK